MVMLHGPSPLGAVKIDLQKNLHGVKSWIVAEGWIVGQHSL